MVTLVFPIYGKMVSLDGMEGLNNQQEDADGLLYNYILISKKKKKDTFQEKAL